MRIQGRLGIRIPGHRRRHVCSAISKDRACRAFLQEGSLSPRQRCTVSHSDVHSYASRTLISFFPILDGGLLISLSRALRSAPLLLRGAAREARRERQIPCFSLTRA